MPAVLVCLFQKLDAVLDSFLLQFFLRQRLALKHECDDDQDLVGCLPEHVVPHARGDDGLTAVHWGALQLLLGGGLRGQGQRSQGVHEEVEPEELRRAQGRVLHVQRADGGQGQSGDVDRELELQELLDGVVHVSPPLGRRHDGGKVVVQQNDVGRVFGGGGACDAHGEPDVRPLQRGGVVGAVARHGHYLPVGEDHDPLLHLEPLHLGSVLANQALVQPVCEHFFVRRVAPRHDPQVGPDLVKLGLDDHPLARRDFGHPVRHLLLHAHQLPEVRARHGSKLLDGAGLWVTEVAVEMLRAQNAAPSRDRNRCLQVVTRHHANVDACGVALLDRGRHFVSQRVFDPRHSHQRQLALRRERLGAVGLLHGRVQLAPLGPSRQVAVRKGNGAHGLRREGTDHVLGFFQDGGAQGGQLASFLHH
mmetsp:Transcript_37798/g.74716  ORF Transcript_37798/g.74716 Transcript_37798/m.74716 type:complete len:420 (+) Transcript_37798:533-1792(+)